MGDVHNEFSGTAFGPVVQAGSIGTLVLPPPTPVVLAGLPPAPEIFVGRDRLLTEILEDVRPRKAPLRLQGTRTAVRKWRSSVDTWEQGRTVVMLSGPPGGGKTGLALRAGHEAAVRKWYNHQLYVDLRAYEDPSLKPDVVGALGALLRALGFPAETMGETVQARSMHYRSRLSGLARCGHPVLVLLDNASSHEQIEPLLPPHPRNCTLVIGRQRLAGAGLTGARQRRVTVFDEAEAVAFLQMAMTKARPGDERAGDLTDLRALAEVCGHLPLALDLAVAKLVAVEHMPVQALVTRLREASGPLDLGSGTTAVRAAFDLSYARLPPEQARLFRLVSLHPGSHFPTEDAAELTGLPLSEVTAHLESLANAHVVAESGAQYGTYRLHDVLRLYARERAEREDPDTVRRHAVARLLRHYVRIARQADAWLRYGSTRGAGDRFADRASALRWLDSENPALVGAVRLAAASGFPADATALALPLTSYFDLRKHWADWTGVHELAARCARETGDHTSEGDLLRHIGRAHAQRRRFDDALDCYHRARRAYRTAGNDQGTRVVLGQVLRLLQDVEVSPWAVAKAITRYERVAEFCRAADDPTTLANVLTNLGNLHYNNGSYTSASNCHLEAMAVRRRAGDVRGVAQSLVNLGNVARRKADPGQAATDYDLASKLFRDADDRYGEAQALENLGLTHLAARNVRAGRAAWRAAADCFAADGHMEESERLRRAVETLGRRRERRALLQALTGRTTFGAGMIAGVSGQAAGDSAGGSGQSDHDGDHDPQQGHDDHIGDGHSFDAAGAHEPQNVINIEHTDVVPDHGNGYGVMDDDHDHYDDDQDHDWD